MLTVALIGCSKTKSTKARYQEVEAKRLYTSDLFRKRVQFVERRGLPWFIISAKCGLLKPTTMLRDYDATMSELVGLKLLEWHLGVAHKLVVELQEFGVSKLSNVTLEFHAGSKYCEPLGSILQQFGVKLSKPTATMGIGQQLAYYKAGRSRPD